MCPKSGKGSRLTTPQDPVIAEKEAGIRDQNPTPHNASAIPASQSESSSQPDLEKDLDEAAKANKPVRRGSTRTASDVELAPALTRTSSLPYTNERFDVEEELAAHRITSIPIAPVVTKDGVILVDWYTTDDPANPQNWSASKKVFVLIQLWSVLGKVFLNDCLC